VSIKSEVERILKGLRAVRFYRQCVRPGYLCFDIGANKGSRAMIFTFLGARTIAVEPNASLTGLLRRFPRVTVEQKAVSDQPGTKTFLINFNDQISTLNPDWQNKWPEFPDWQERSVECTTLDDLIQRHGLPDFCKIDVEGHEAAVLNGLSKALPMLSFEAAPDFQKNTALCVDRLESLGRYEYNFSGGDNFSWAVPHWVGSAEARTLANREAGDIYARLTS
jgi:FkbM family methyltransferase